MQDSSVKQKLNPMDTVPMNVPVLVYLEKPHFQSHLHVGVFHENVNFIGGQFDYNMPKAIGWVHLPEIERH